MEILDEEREGGAAERRRLEAASEPGLAAERQDGVARKRKQRHGLKAAQAGSIDAFLSKKRSEPPAAENTTGPSDVAEK